MLTPSLLPLIHYMSQFSVDNNLKNITGKKENSKSNFQTFYCEIQSKAPTNFENILRATDNGDLLLSGDVEQNPGPVFSKPNRLINRGNVCYANSTIQLLWMIPELVDSFIHTTSLYLI